MNILIVSPFLPWPPHDGARIRILETIRFLSRKHNITLLANVSPEEEPGNVEALRELGCTVDVETLADSHFSRLGRMIRGLASGSSFIQSFHYNKKLARRITHLTSEREFDVVQIELSFMARYLSSISQNCKAKTVIATHNIETQRFRRELRLSGWDARRAVLVAESLLFPNWELNAIKRFDGVIAVSEADASWIGDHVKGKAVELVPNGVDTEYFQSRSMPDRSTEQSLVFTGLMDYPPNSDAVCWFVEEIFPAVRNAFPKLQFKIVGARPAEKVSALANTDGVVVTGEVPDIRPFVDEAAAFVVPLRSGGGTRLKILQAMSLSCPVISTAVGAEGLDVAEGENILFAEDAGQFVKQIGTLIESPSLAEHIGAAGRLLVTAKYDWQRCLSGEEALHERLRGVAAP